MLTYKGYIARISFDDEAEIFHGEVINTRDVVTFQGTTVSQLKKAFIPFCTCKLIHSLLCMT